MGVGRGPLDLKCSWTINVFRDIGVRFLLGFVDTCKGNEVISKITGSEYITSKNRQEFKRFKEDMKEGRKRQLKARHMIL